MVFGRATNLKGSSPRLKRGWRRAGYAADSSCGLPYHRCVADCADEKAPVREALAGHPGAPAGNDQCGDFSIDVRADSVDRANPVGEPKPAVGPAAIPYVVLPLYGNSVTVPLG